MQRQYCHAVGSVTFVHAADHCGDSASAKTLRSLTGYSRILRSSSQNTRLLNMSSVALSASGCCRARSRS